MKCFIPRYPNLKKKWKLRICEQVCMGYEKDGAEAWLTNEGTIIRIEKDPE